MIRNEYRRAFIMLRAGMPGYSGHARLERRTLTGSLYFIVSAPEGAGTLAAALVGRGKDGYYAAPVGTLRRDRRGQWTLAWTFDPRDIDGRPLESYPWVAVARSDGGETVLTGNVESSHPVDADRLRAAVRALFAPAEAEAPAADLPAADDPPPVEPAIAPTVEVVEAAVETTAGAANDAVPGEAAAETPAEPAPTDPVEMRGDVKIYRRSKARVFTAARPPEPEPQPEAEAPVASEPPAEVQPQAEPEPPAEAEAPVEAEASQPATAAQALGLDIASPWPGSAEKLRRLFATQAPRDDGPADDFTYVRASMPAGSGYGACWIGLRAANGAIEKMRWALPGGYAPQPPAGLEGYAWSESNGQGWWTLTAAPDGQPVQN